MTEETKRVYTPEELILPTIGWELARTHNRVELINYLTQAKAYHDAEGRSFIGDGISLLIKQLENELN